MFAYKRFFLYYLIIISPIKKLIFYSKNIATSLPAIFFVELIFSFFHYLLLLLSGFFYKVSNYFYVFDISTNTSSLNIVNSVVFTVSLIMTSLLVFLEMVIIVFIIVYDYYNDERIPFTAIFKKSYEKLFELLTFSSLPAFLLIISLPRENITTPNILNFTPPSFVIDEIYKNPVWIFIVSIIFLVAYYFVYRNIFILQEALFSHVSLWKATKNSWKITKENYNLKKFFWAIVYSSVITAFLIIPITFVLGVIEKTLYFIAPLFGLISVPAAKFVSAISNYPLGGIYTFIFLSITTFSYIQIKEKEGIIIKEYYKFEPSQVNFLLNGIHFLREPIKKHFKIFLTLFLLIVILLSYGSHKLVAVETLQNKNFEIMAHRGSTKNSFENTLSSIQEAIEKKADFVEIDVFLSKDGVLVLSHDPSLKRISKEDIKIKDLNLSDIKKIKTETGDSIPSLEEVFIYTKDKIKLNIELKPLNNEGDIVEKINTIVTKYKMEDSALISSLDLETALAVKEKNPNLKVGYIVFASTGNLSNIPLDFFSIEKRIFSFNLVEEIHRKGKKVYIWTVNNDNNMDDYILSQTDGIITDELEDLREIYQDSFAKISKNGFKYLYIFGFKFFF